MKPERMTPPLNAYVELFPSSSTQTLESQNKISFKNKTAYTHKKSLCAKCQQRTHCTLIAGLSVQTICLCDVMKAGSIAAICSITKIGSELNPPHCLITLSAWLLWTEIQMQCTDTF